ncbi:glycogen/starch synthase [Francisella tularensis]|uniref:glycogen/starch synthase n=1 Tax=Francisella tularensis TaxID=263 RepID=UPI00295B1927|nr:glycogen/starch synthase [Francisella tularensis]
MKASELYSVKKALKTVITVQNLAYQGIFTMSVLPDLDFTGISSLVSGLEFDGKESIMTAGLYFSDKLTKFRPTYTKET